MLKNHIFFRNILFYSLFSLFIPILGNNTKVSYKDIDKNSKKIAVQVNLDKEDFVYKDHINISADHPDIILSEWKVDIAPTNHFSKEFRNNKKIFNKSFTISFKASKKADTNYNIRNAHIHLAYYLHSKHGMIEETIPFNLSLRYARETYQDTYHNVSHPEYIERKGRGDQGRSEQNHAEKVETHIDTNIETKNPDQSQDKKSVKQENKKISWTQYLQDLVKTTESTWIRILLALLLGVLLSLTPCIYPMIPITVGILQSQGSKSVANNFFLSFVYVMGIAITFAILGLIAAFTGQIFGSILTNPIFVIIVVLFLTYLALSMLGFYEMYIPRFMQSSAGPDSKKSILSIFIFGLASGSIASPCVSPGLVLLLSIVTAMGNKLLGFFLLFAFGLGLGTPLLIAGTFSGSINKLPKAGMWMIEIKKIFGLLLFGVCFYFLSNILPWNVLLWIISGFMLTIGIFYLYSIKSYNSTFWKFFKNIIGIGLIILSVLTLFNAYKATYLKKIVIKFWEKNYDAAVAKAKKENKKLFLDFWATHCSICKAIDKKVFQDQKVIDAFKKKFVSVKIDITDPSAEPFVSLNKKYKNLNFVPTFLLLDPKTGKIIKKWSSEFYSMSNKKIIGLINKL